jgi:predicted RNA-binding protein with RPS1 domain
MTASTVEKTAPQIAINDIGSEEDLLAAIDATIKYFNDGDIVEGTIVKVDRDEVLLDIGYKTEGVIPSRELSIKHDVDPNEVVKVGDEVEALVLQKEDKEGRLILSKKRAQYERAWGTIEKVKEEDGVVTGTVIEVVKGGLILDIGLRGFLPASLVEMRRVRDLQPYVGKEIEAKIIELDKNRNNVVLSRRAWLEQTQSEVRTTFLKELSKGQIRKRCRVLDRQLRCVRRPRRRRRSRPRLRAVLEAHRPPVRGRRGRRRGHRRGARRRHGPRARLAVAEGHPGRPVAALRPHPRDRPGRAGQGHQAGARSVRSCASTRASRAWSTSPSWPSATSSCPSRSSRSAPTSSSRSSTSTSSVAASRCRSSRPTRTAPTRVEFDPTLYGMAASTTRRGTTSLPRGLRRRDQRVARGLRGAA